MNKKLLIGAIVASILIFVWQFIAWGLSDLHANSMKHTPKQDVIMKVLNENLEEGHYFLPNLPKEASQKEHQEYMAGNEGKPWAQISYHKSMKISTGMNMFRGWSVDFIAALLLCWILLQITALNFKKTFLITLGVGFIGWLTINYINGIWFETNVLSALVDNLVQWGVVGLWLGWWLNRK